ncbi:FLU1-II [Fomitopsis serialis]|uniref:FLU1-II n=1 Tax=Fomitopsis serialis TaxID=139415 RepID=UPI0020078EDC|nr:FLU1-II [Neoantrodia serialis]KAH9931894.1 FLU1-II [Neoantrodia serialis]
MVIAATFQHLLSKQEHPRDVPTRASAWNSRLADHGVRYVRVQWVDLTNTVRFQVIPATRFAQLCEKARPGIPMTARTLGFINISFAKGFGETGEHLYVFDLDSFRICTYAPGHAVVMGWFQLETPSPEGSLAVGICPRTLLHKTVSYRCWTKAGLTFLCGFESEFILLGATSPEPDPLTREGWCRAANLRTGSVQSIVIEEIADNLQEARIELQTYHVEGAAGQFEVVTGPLQPLEAADALVYTRETIHNTASKHGLRATFAPRVKMNSFGSGQHVHISVHSSDASDTDPYARADAVKAPTLTNTERSFVQALVNHLPALCALMLPTPCSYWRVQDGISSGGTYACWGAENKESPIRVCGEKGSHHIEVKIPDATANPYVMLAGLLAVGVQGVRSGAEMTAGNCMKSVVSMSDEERQQVGMENAKRLPRTVEDARRLFKEDGVLREALGDSFIAKYISVNESLEEFMTMPTEEEVVRHLVEHF